MTFVIATKMPIAGVCLSDSNGTKKEKERENKGTPCFGQIQETKKAMAVFALSAANVDE